MKTALLLMVQYDARAVIPVDLVCRDYFAHLSPDKFIRKCNTGEIKGIPLVRMDGSQKTAKGVHLTDLAAYIDARHDAAAKEAGQMAKATGEPA